MAETVRVRVVRPVAERPASPPRTRFSCSYVAPAFMWSSAEARRVGVKPLVLLHIIAAVSPGSIWALEQRLQLARLRRFA